MARAARESAIQHPSTTWWTPVASAVMGAAPSTSLLQSQSLRPRVKCGVVKRSNRSASSACGSTALVALTAGVLCRLGVMRALVFHAEDVWMTRWSSATQFSGKSKEDGNPVHW